VSTLDLSNPAHREALRWSCDVVNNRPQDISELLSLPGTSDYIVSRKAVLGDLSSPEQSAALVRARLEGCGVMTHEHHEPDWDGECDAEVVLRVEDGALGWADYHDRWELSAQATAVLLLALLACTDAVGALAALREAGR
jgi:hypothetical protein